MATPKYDALVEKVRDWSNKKEVATIPNSVIEDCLNYSADFCYTELRIPPLEHIVSYTISSSNNLEDSRYSTIESPTNLLDFIYIRIKPDSLNESHESIVFNEVTDSRTFLDAYSERYSSYGFMWLDNKIKISPQLKEDVVLEIAYHRRLPDLNATYSVLPINFIVGLPLNDQPYLSVDQSGTTLYFATSDNVTKVFLTEAEALTYDPTVTSEVFVGKESPNWLRDSNERTLLFGALKYIGSYLFDDKMEDRYSAKLLEEIKRMNNEEKFRRARGGNVQINFNSNGLI